MSDLGTYLDYGSTEISDDLNPVRTRQPGKQEPSNERKKMLTDMLATSLEYGRATARTEGLYADEYGVPREDIIPGANLWLQNENTGFTYEYLTELLQATDMQDGIDWAWSLTGAPSMQLDTVSNVAAYGNVFSAVIDYGHAAWDLTSGDVGGARDAWNNIGDRLYGYDPNPYGSQVANVLGVHNWQDAVWAGLDVVDTASLGFGGEIIRPIRMMMANVIRRQGKNPEVAAAIYRSLMEEWPERAIVRRAAEGEYILPNEGYLATRHTNPALGSSFGSAGERPQGLYTSLFEEEGLQSSFTGLSDVAEFAVVKPNNVLDVSDVQADLSEMMGRGIGFLGGGQADTGVTALKHLAEQPGYTGQPLEWITRFTPEEQALREIPAESIPDWLRESGHSMSYRAEERQLWSRTARILEYAETRFPDQNWRGMLMIDDVPSGTTGEELGFQIWDTLLKLNQGSSGLGGNAAQMGLMQDPLGLLFMGLGASEARHVGYDAMIKRFPQAWGEATSRTLGQVDPSTVNELVLLTDDIATPTDMADELLQAYRRGELPLSRQERLLGEWDELGEVEQARIADEYRTAHEDAWGEPAEALLAEPEVLMRWHNTEGRGYRDNIESQFTGLTRNDERAIWSGLQIQEREMIEADYKAAYPDKIDPDPAEMVAWDHRNSGRPETWMYTEDRSGRRTYKGHDAFENPAKHDIEAVKAELMYSDAQWEQAKRAWANDPAADRDYAQYLKDNPDYVEGETRGLMAAEARWDDPTLDPNAIWRAGDELEGPPLGEHQPLEGPPGTPDPSARATVPDVSTRLSDFPRVGPDKDITQHEAALREYERIHYYLYGKVNTVPYGPEDRTELIAHVEFLREFVNDPRNVDDPAVHAIRDMLKWGEVQLSVDRPIRPDWGPGDPEWDAAKAQFDIFSDEVNRQGSDIGESAAERTLDRQQSEELLQGLHEQREAIAHGEGNQSKEAMRNLEAWIEEAEDFRAGGYGSDRVRAALEGGVVEPDEAHLRRLWFDEQDEETKRILIDQYRHSIDEGWRSFDVDDLTREEIDEAIELAHRQGDEFVAGEAAGLDDELKQLGGPPGTPERRPLPENLGERIGGGPGDRGTVHDPGPDRVLDTYQDIDIYEILFDRGIDVPENMTHMDALAILGDDYPFWNQFHQGASPGMVDYEPVMQYRTRMRELHEGESTFGAGGFDVDPPSTPSYTQDEIDQIVRNQGGLTDKEIAEATGIPEGVIDETPEAPSPLDDPDTKDAIDRMVEQGKQGWPGGADFTESLTDDSPWRPENRPDLPDDATLADMKANADIPVLDNVSAGSQANIRELEYDALIPDSDETSRQWWDRLSLRQQRNVMADADQFGMGSQSSRDFESHGLGEGYRAVDDRPFGYWSGDTQLTDESWSDSWNRSTGEGADYWDVVDTEYQWRVNPELGSDSPVVSGSFEAPYPREIERLYGHEEVPPLSPRGRSLADKTQPKSDYPSMERIDNSGTTRSGYGQGAQSVQGPGSEYHWRSNSGRGLKDVSDLHLAQILGDIDIAKIHGDSDWELGILAYHELAYRGYDVKSLGMEGTFDERAIFDLIGVNLDEVADKVRLVEESRTIAQNRADTATRGMAEAEHYDMAESSFENMQDPSTVDDAEMERLFRHFNSLGDN